MKKLFYLVSIILFSLNINLFAEAKEEKAVKKPENNDSFLDKVKNRYVSYYPYIMLPVMTITIIKNGKVRALIPLARQCKHI